ncbi:transcriptional regulator, IclR family [Saccharopolyspora kobensis]|uniref:Glycerol operon regulatory protein n=1 Tax=Saccharopolyspora kobensis TaxID=146035 RepID=A0A1H5XIM1_9PSEU|nr:IclR family transcriptional regulator [Saccharopolyspora kobensis]SEG11473.1 transcriptional regulator, IclR family [Saccharopolyspora kobensis]SFE42256.1 transcriptional regulator, IclR family [Saccharopolyspora kobensis]
MRDFGTDRRTPPGLPQTADRALQVLLAFDRAHPERGVTEIATEFGLHTSVAQRLLATLAHRGFLVRNDANRRYRIGPAALHLGRMWDRAGALDLLVRPLLAELAADTGHSVLLALPDSAHMRCVVVAEGADGRLRDYPLTNELYPAHAGATSKAFYAFLPADARARIFTDRPLARFTDRTVTDLALLERQFAEVREAGWAFTVGEYDVGVATLAAPVFLRDEPYGSVSVGWQTDQHEHDPADWAERLRELSTRIGWRLTRPMRARRAVAESGAASPSSAR